MTATGLPDPHLHAAFYSNVATKRALAWCVDVAVILTASLLLTPLTLFTSLFYFPVFYLVVGVVYRTLTIARGSATWGMWLMSIELRDVEGDRFDLPQAAIHTAAYTLSWVVFPLQLLSAGVMAGTDRAQGLTDLVMGSAAINRGAGI